MVNETRPTNPVSSVASIPAWERYRGEARDAVFARLVNAPAGTTGPNGQRLPATGVPSGLVRAVVLQANSDSEALVEIGGKSYLVNTQKGLTAGSNIMLRLLDDRTFLGLPAPVRPVVGNGAGTPGHESQIEGNDESGTAADIPTVRGVSPTAMPALARLDADTGDVKIQLSGPARLLSALASQPGSSQRMVPLSSLALDGALDTTQAAESLQRAVEQSGLFYESHLQEWREGRRSLDALRAEPQAALSPGPPSKTADEPLLAPRPDEHSSPEQDAAKGLHAALGAIPADVRPLVQDQIALLESGRLALQGSWDGREFTLEVEPDDTAAHNNSDIPLSWRVKVRLDTPHLGKLQLEVALAGTAAQISVSPDTKTIKGQALRDVQAQLTGGAVDLQQSLDARGLQMSGFSITTASRLPARS